MVLTNESYYVYVYIDPRNYEEFYYGKGKGKRKDAHLKDLGKSDKAKKIQDIKKAGLEPIIRVIAKGLTEKEAFLVEKTLLWKLGKVLTNKSKGQLKAHFRPPVSMYKEIKEFDFSNDVYYVNVGEGPHRNWDDCRKYGFLAAGQGKRYREAMETLNPGDIVIAYLKGHGYVGIGRVREKAVNVANYRHNHKTLHQLKLIQPNIFKNHHLPDKSEYLVKVKWIKTFPRDQAKWKKQSGLFTTQQVVARLNLLSKTARYINRVFDIDLDTL